MRHFEADRTRQQKNPGRSERNPDLATVEECGAQDRGRAPNSNHKPIHCPVTNKPLQIGSQLRGSMITRLQLSTFLASLLLGATAVAADPSPDPAAPAPAADSKKTFASDNDRLDGDHLKL